MAVKMYMHLPQINYSGSTCGAHHASGAASIEYFLSNGTYGSQLSTALPGKSALLVMSFAKRCMVILLAVVAAFRQEGASVCLLQRRLACTTRNALARCNSQHKQAGRQPGGKERAVECRRQVCKCRRLTYKRAGQQPGRQLRVNGPALPCLQMQLTHSHRCHFKQPFNNHFLPLTAIPSSY